MVVSIAELLWAEQGAFGAVRGLDRWAGASARGMHPTQDHSGKRLIRSRGRRWPGRLPGRDARGRGGLRRIRDPEERHSTDAGREPILQFFTGSYLFTVCQLNRKANPLSTWEPQFGSWNLIFDPYLCNLEYDRDNMILDVPSFCCRCNYPTSLPTSRTGRESSWKKWSNSNTHVPASRHSYSRP